MLPAQHRLRHKMDIDRVMKSKTGVFDAVCGIKFVKTERSYSRFAVVVGGKVSKNATERNRVRRHYQEALQSFVTKIEGKYDVVLLTSKAALDLGFEEKRDRLVGVLKKAKIL